MENCSSCQVQYTRVLQCLWRLHVDEVPRELDSLFHRTDIVDRYFSQNVSLPSIQPSDNISTILLIRVHLDLSGEDCVSFQMLGV